VSNARAQRAAGVRSIRVRTAAIATALLLAGALTAAITVAAQASGTAANGNKRLSLGYTCSLPTGTQPVRIRAGVTIAATFPAAVAAGQRIRPTGVRMTVSLPPAAVAALRQRGAILVSSAWLLSVDLSQQTATTSWQGQSATAQSLPTAGGLLVVAQGHAAPVTVTSRRAVSFRAADLTLALDLASAAGTSAASDSPSPASSGSASANSVSSSPSSSDSASPSPSSSDSASPSPSSSDSASPGPVSIGVTCAPASGRGATLDSVPVAGARASRTSPPRRHKLKIPKGCGDIKVHGDGVAVCGYITGYSDVKKAYGAALLQPKRPAKPALLNIDFAYRHIFKPGKLIAFSTGELYYQGHHELPPVRATFLAFRFVPVTATLVVTELTPIKIRSVSGTLAPPYPLTVRGTTRVKIRISDVDVNGVPLAIGPHCRPVKSPQLTLIGHGKNTSPPSGYTVPTGGPLSGQLTIPAFTDCGVTENLDPLLTGSISGPGNYVLMTQGKLCGPSEPQNWTCPPPVPKPIH
jgi:hypothetical protein